MSTLVHEAPAFDLSAALASACRTFGFSEFTPKQEELIRASVQGHDVLGVLRTGGGKSACFQVPGIIARQRTLVVSPLIALQEAQVRALRNIGVKAWAFHSNMDDVRKQAVHHYFKVASKTEPSFLYISPEQLLTELFHQRFDQVGFQRLAVDEAHCVSTWGDSFRPDYQRIRVAAKRLRIPICSAFTATVDTKIEADIRNRIPLRPGFVRVAEDPMRENLAISVKAIERTARRQFLRLQQLLKHPDYNGPAIVYYNSLDGSARLYLRMREAAGFLRETGYTPYLFHAQLPPEDKWAALQGFLKDEKPLVIATTAFGMGMDRANIRQIIHYRTPRHLIEYAQQIGRGGRDGLPALCTTFKSPLFDDESHQGWEANMRKFESPTYDFVERTHLNLCKQLGRITSEKKRRAYNIGHFKLRMTKFIQETVDIRHKSTYMSRFYAALAILQRSGVIVENENGLHVRQIEPGGKYHLKLLALTEMFERTEVRELERVSKFFASPTPNQQLLWDILSQD